MTAKVDIDDDAFSDRLDAILDAFTNEDYAKVKEIAGTILLPPDLAMQRKRYMSKEDILDLGYDMSLVEAKFGKDWYEKP